MKVSQIDMGLDGTDGLDMPSEQRMRYELVKAAIAYAMETVNSTMGKNYFPWDKKYFKPKDKLRNLVRAGALIAAEIDKIQNRNN